MTFTLVLLTIIILILLVGFYLIWRKLSKLEDLINELGTMVGEWIDGQDKDK